MQYLFYFASHCLYCIVAGNVLLLRNQLEGLSADIGEVSQEKLLSLVAERLLDSNSNVNVRIGFVIIGNVTILQCKFVWQFFFIVLQNKDAGYVENQQQNIADAIDLLPRLATGIDVNLKFTRSGSFIYLSDICIHH